MTWIALIPGDYPARLFTDGEVYRLSGGVTWPGQHHRDYSNAKVAHDACCPGRHRTRPESCEAAAELWRAMRLRLSRPSRQQR